MPQDQLKEAHMVAGADQDLAFPFSNLCGCSLSSHILQDRPNEPDVVEGADQGRFSRIIDGPMCIKMKTQVKHGSTTCRAGCCSLHIGLNVSLHISLH